MSFLSRFGIYTISKPKIHKYIGYSFHFYFKSINIGLSLLFLTRNLEDQPLSVYKVLLPISQTVVFGDIFDYDQDKVSTRLVFILSQTFIFEIYLLFGYLIYTLIAKKNPSNVIVYIWKFSTYILPYVAYPLFSFGIAIIHSYHIDKNLVLFGSGSLAFPILAGMAGILAVSFSIVKLKLYGMPIKVGDPLGMKTGDVLIIELLEYVLIYIIYKLTSESSLKILILVLIQVILSYYKVFSLSRIMPYFKLSVIKRDLQLSVISMVLNILNFIAASYNVMNEKISFIFFLWILLIPIACKVGGDLTEKRIHEIFVFSKQLSKWEVLHLPHIIKYFLKKRKLFDERTRFLSLGQIMIYGKEYNTSNNLNRREHIFEDPNMSAKYIDSHLRTSMKKNPKSLTLIANCLFNSLERRKSMYEVISLLAELKADEKKGVLTELVIAFFENRIESKLKAESLNSDDSHLDVNSFISITENFSILKTMIEEQIALQLKFWNHYDEKKIRFSNFLKLSTEIENKKNMINLHFNNLSEINNRRYPLPDLTYGLYLSQVCNNPTKSLEFMKRNKSTLKRLENETTLNLLNDKTLYNNLTSYIEVSNGKKEFGNIKFVSPSFLKEYRHNRAKLEDNHINNIMPSFYRSFHFKAINKYLKTGKKKMLDTTRKDFVLEGDGYIRLTYIHVKVYPRFDSGLNFIAIFRPVIEDSQYIIIRSDGYVEGVSQRIGNVLSVGQEPYHITEICPEYDLCHEMIKCTFKNDPLSTEIEHKQENPYITFTQLPTEYARLETAENKDQNTLNTKRLNFNKKTLNSKANLLLASGILSPEQIHQQIKDFQERGTVLTYETKNQEDKKRYFGLTFIKIEFYDNEWIAILTISDFKEANTDANASREILDLLRTLEKSKYDSIIVRDRESSALVFDEELEGNDAKKVSDYIQFLPPEEDQLLENPAIIFEKTKLNPNEESNNVRIEYPRKERELRNTDLFKNISPRERPTKQDNVDMAFESSQRTSTYNQKAKFKMIDLCVNEKYTEKKFIYFIAGFFFTLLAGQAIIIAQNEYMSTSFEEIKKKGDIVITAYYRADNTDLTFWGVRLMNTARLNYYDDNTIKYEEFRSILLNYMNAMKQKNYNLETQVSIIEESLQKEFYEKNVYLYEIDKNFVRTGEYQILNTFEAIDKIYVIAKTIYDMPFPSNPPQRTYEMEYLISNSMNSIMLEFERTISLTQVGMSNAISNFITDIETISGVGIGIVSLYFLLSFYIFRALCSNLVRFSAFFMNISHKEAGVARKQLNDFAKKLSNNFINVDNNEDEIFKDLEFDPNSIKYSRKNRNMMAEKKVSFKRVKFSYFTIVIKIWPVLIFMFYAIIQELKHAYPSIDKMNQLQLQMVQVMYYMYITDITFISLIDLVLYNGTTIVRNKPIVEEIQATTKYGGDTQEYIKVFRNSDGSYDDNIKDILFNISCSDTSVVPFDYNDLCTELSGGSGYMGLIQTNPIYEKTMSEFANSWIYSARTPDLVPQYLNRYYEYVTKVNNFQNFFIVAIQQAVNQGFFDYIANEKSYSNRNIVIYSIITEAFAIIIFIFALKSILNQENRLKEILKIIPASILIANRQLRLYLTRNSGKLGESLKNM